MVSKHSSTRWLKTTNSRVLAQALRQLRKGEVCSRAIIPNNEDTVKQPTLKSLSMASSHTLPLVPFFNIENCDPGDPLLLSSTLSQPDLTASSSTAPSTCIAELRPGAERQPTFHHSTDSFRSLRAAWESPSTSHLRPSQSTLRLPANEDLSMAVTFASQQTSILTPNLRKARGTRDLRNNVDFDSICTERTLQSSSVGENSSIRTTNSHGTFASVLSVTHFQSFCVLDTQIDGCPVTATTEDMLYSMEIGDRFKLNIQASKGSWIDLVFGAGINGEEITYLVMFTPLVTLGTEKSRFVLAALVDVTEFVQDAAGEPDYNSRPVTSTSLESSLRNSCRLSPDDLLGGCVLPDDKDAPSLCTKGSASTQSIRRRHQEPSEDVWLGLLSEGVEEESTSSQQSNSVTSKTSSMSRSPTTSMTMTTKHTIIDDILSKFMTDLEKLYANFFVLAKTPLDDQYFEICSVSPSVYVRGEYITGHLNHTPAESMAEFSRGLAAGCRFRTIIRWGDQGKKMQCYSVPLHGRQSTTWLCILVSMDMSLLW